MTFVNITAEDIESVEGDIVGGIFSWHDKLLSSMKIDPCAIPCINGAKIDGFEFLTRLREEGMARTLKLIVVKNAEYKVIPFHVGEAIQLDLVRRIGEVGRGIEYWFEEREKKNKVKSRLSEVCLEVKGYTWVELPTISPVEVNKVQHADDSVEEDKGVKVEGGVVKRQVMINLIIPCKGDVNTMKKEILDCESLYVSGMDVNISVQATNRQEKHMLVTEWHSEGIDLSMANLALMKIKSWKDLTPLTDIGGKSLFSDSINATLLANAFFSKKSVPAFNLLVVGPKRNQKTAAISFLTKYMMGGSIISGSTSTGKGWLVSHKEGVEPSKMFSEKYCLMIDEALKFNTDSDLGMKLRLKNHFVKHMEIIERKYIEASSGNNPVKGRMKCSLFCVDNPDDQVERSLGQAYKMQDASFRRWGFLYMDRSPGINLDYMTTEQAYDMMLERMEDFGGIDAVRSLLLLSRKKCDDEKNNADVAWVNDLRNRLKSEADNCNFLPTLSFISSISDLEIRARMITELKEHIDFDMPDAIQAAWLSAAAMRGWELCKTFESFKLCYDDEQKKLAEMIVRELMLGRVKLLFKGIKMWHEGHSEQGVERRNRFGGDY